MELKVYLEILKKYQIFIILTVIFSALMAFIIAAKTPQLYTASQTFYILVPQSQETQEYQYEGFFAQEKAAKVTDTAVAILDSQDFKSQITGQNQSITIRKLAPQVIRLTAASQNQEDPQRLIEKTIASFNSQFSEQSISLKGVASIPNPTLKNKIDKQIITAAGSVFGLLFALLIISFKSYFKL